MLAKTGFEDAIVGTASYKFDTDTNGYLVVDGSGQTVKGSKRISINSIEAAAELNDVESVMNVFCKTIPSTKTLTYDDLATTFSVKWTAE